jgi:hypothetical protein
MRHYAEQILAVDALVAVTQDEFENLVVAFDKLNLEGLNFRTLAQW